MTYADIANILADLPHAVYTVRRSRGLNLREAADQAGIGFNTLSRIERGGGYSSDSGAAVLRWLGDVGVETEKAFREMVRLGQEIGS